MSSYKYLAYPGRCAAELSYMYYRHFRRNMFRGYSLDLTLLRLTPLSLVSLRLETMRQYDDPHRIVCQLAINISFRPPEERIS